MGGVLHVVGVALGLFLAVGVAHFRESITIDGFAIRFQSLPFSTKRGGVLNLEGVVPAATAQFDCEVKFLFI